MREINTCNMEKTYREVLLSGRPAFVGTLDINEKPYRDLNPGDEVFSIGELCENDKQTTSNRVDLFQEPAIFLGWFAAHEWYRNLSLIFELPKSCIKRYQLEAHEKVYSIYNLYSTGQLMVSRPMKSGIFLFKAKFNLYPPGHKTWEKIQ